ncbi:endolysin [Arthrobacter phage Zartrosa]|uniref:Endolysin n=1 Tax=Arthrobacter phage Zartrosa TaxID=2603257 RepID=A0A5B8WEP2_9CAUD|nr:amidase [Arthrobacter phage Zartrosa]QED11140.1 endolysin [Arthrobacter phage Zartrosa]
MATNAVQEAWMSGAVGRAIDPDRAYGLQCVDVADDYADAIFPGVGWRGSVGAVNGARDFKGRSNQYVTWVPNVVGDVNSIPQRGDIIVWDGDALNQFGHVAVVLRAEQSRVLVIQQDGFNQRPAFTGWLLYDQPGTGPCLGWLRPNVPLDNPLQSNQREVGAAGVNERAEPSTSASIGRVFKAGDILTVKGYVTNAEGGWFVGAFSGTYFHSTAFTNPYAGDLPNLTPPPPPVLSPKQRVVGPDGAILRKQPDKNAAIVATFKAGEIVQFDGYVHGTRPYGDKSSDGWFVGQSGFMYSLGFTDPMAGALPDLTAKYFPTTPAPLPPLAEKYSFAKRWNISTGVKPAAIENMQRGNFGPRPEYLVIHQIDDPNRAPANGDWAGSATNWFATPRPASPSSAHFVAQAPHFISVVDTVDRAFHAGAGGNDWLSIEVPPNPDDATIELVKQFQREWRDKMGYVLKLKRHKEVPGATTSCGTNIPLERFDISAEKPEVPGKTEPDSEVTADQEKAIRSYNDWLLDLYKTRKDSK